MPFDCIVIARSVSDAAIQDMTQTTATQTLDCRAALAMTTVDRSIVVMLLITTSTRQAFR
jgi:hypothetical protein